VLDDDASVDDDGGDVGCAAVQSKGRDRVVGAQVVQAGG
jgi:hypothetical protein